MDNRSGVIGNAAREEQTAVALAQQRAPNLATVFGRRYPEGIVSKFEPSNSKHRGLLADHPAATYLMTTFSRSTWLANHPGKAEYFFGPHQKLVLTSTEQDEKLKGRTPEDEFERLDELRPAYYVPSDRPVYEDMSRRRQLEEIDRCMSGTERLYDLLAPSTIGTRLVPLAKGWEPWHFERCNSTFKQLGAGYCAFDVTQYPSIEMIVNDLETLIDVIDPAGILLIGRHAPSHLERLPPAIKAAAGKSNWRNYCIDDSGAFSRERYTDWERRARGALLDQATLGRFDSVTEKEVKANG